jgi:hypothetical protein
MTAVNHDCVALSFVVKVPFHILHPTCELTKEFIHTDLQAIASLFEPRLLQSPLFGLRLDAVSTCAVAVT